MASYTIPQSNIFVDEYRMPEYKVHHFYEDELEVEYEEKIDVDVFHDDDNDDSDGKLGNDSLYLESCVTKNEVDPRDKIRA